MIESRPELEGLVELAPKSFIFERQNSIPPKICEEMIERFESNPDDQYQGTFSRTDETGTNLKTNTDVKRSTDMAISGNPLWRGIDHMLHRSLSMALDELKVRYPYFSMPFRTSGYAVQRTNPGEFYHWHSDSGCRDLSDRQLVALWYLNDVEGPGGETQFVFQDVSVKPEQGKLVLFPPFWTHEHRGNILQQGVKYVATTWIVYA